MDRYAFARHHGSPDDGGDILYGRFQDYAP